jgi:hypothetical protein
MSKHRKPHITSSASGAKEIQKQSAESSQKSDKLQQESTLPAAVTALTSSEQGSTNFTFTAAELHLELVTLHEIIAEGIKQIEYHSSQINEITPNLNPRVSSNSSEEIIEYINLVIRVKGIVAENISWLSVIASAAHYLILNFNEYLPDDLINDIKQGLSTMVGVFDAALTSMPSGSTLGISLAPDQKQVSETKSLISDVFSRIEKIKQENEEASQEWGAVEQNAYERILEGSNRNVSGEEFLSWLSELEQGNDV